MIGYQVVSSRLEGRGKKKTRIKVKKNKVERENEEQRAWRKKSAGCPIRVGQPAVLIYID